MLNQMGTYDFDVSGFLRKGKPKDALPKRGSGVDMSNADTNGFRLAVRDGYDAGAMQEAYNDAYPHNPEDHDYPSKVLIAFPYSEQGRNFFVTYQKWAGNGQMVYETDGEHILRWDKNADPSVWIPGKQYGRNLVTDEPDPDKPARDLLDELFREKSRLEADGHRSNTDEMKAVVERIKKGQAHLKRNGGVKRGVLTFFMPHLMLGGLLPPNAQLSVFQLHTKSNADIENIQRALGQAYAFAPNDVLLKTWWLERRDVELTTPLYGKKVFSIVHLFPEDSTWIIGGMVGQNKNLLGSGPAAPQLSAPQPDEDEFYEAEVVELA